MAELFTIEEMQTQLVALYKLRRSGAQRVRVKVNNEERELHYKSGADLAAAIADLERRLAGPQPRNIVIRSTKGW